MKAGGVLRYVLEKAEVAVKGLLKVILARAPKEKRRAGEKASIFLENTEIITNRKLAEIQWQRPFR